MGYNKLIKTLVFILLLVFYGSLLLHKIELPVADDMARHVKNGELILEGNFNVFYKNVYSYTESDHVFVNHHWLSGVVFYLLHQAVGWGGLVIFKVIIFLLTFLLLFSVSLKKANFWLVALFSIPTIFILSERTALRPEIFSYLFTAVFLYLLTDLEEHPERKRILWLIPLQLLWVNMHLFFVIGPALVAGFIFARVILNRKNLKNDRLIKKLTVLLMALIVVSFINPNGISGAFYPLQIFNNYGVGVEENQSSFYFSRLRPPLDNLPISIFFWLVFILAVSFLFNLKKLSLFYLLAGVATVIGGLKVLRLLPFFGLIFLPAVSANFSKSFDRLKSVFLKRFLVIIFIGLLTLLIYMNGIGKFSNYKKPGIGLTATSNSSAEFFKKQGLRGPIFNDYDMGSYLAYHFYPDERVFVDNRPEAYSASFFSNTYYSMIQNEDKWKKMLEKYQFNVIFLYQYDKADGLRQFIYNRIHDPLWALVYADSYTVILLKNNLENQDTIQRFGITPENAEEKLGSLLQSENYDDMVAAADIFNYLERPNLGMKTFLQIVEKWPKKGKIWMIMGEWESEKNPHLAITYLEKAISVGHRTAEAYSYLGLAYKNIGEIEKAEQAFTKALRINPDRQEAREFLEAISPWR
ncbi:MAG: hypothetical protein A3B91_04570 [Candidatus Yanofskybacteria bacterium RIFCSPHIGHO2_02_FULL_41_29]|uniref:Uncharacterized protein n=1 Tax=Candidatus Yanofskybacteria bacterium RIFCSPHIGHO2_01_FULL_41_53 TaxID=1802663 RepID=A0A1F8EIV7_9BACT|nr:MAG: hypothetical protein A2650_04615 [Candidatus Yanofskybacteria bacterium RIFCSPHIGHO2_01_FULL_41_53]OGN10347.1 MAG: hypothetical protein A3B91_04570 [Candidatus Yanofskybacteria bacterium RIFCSPHIGHO2_02_FULL_41_29]OGN17444.1 MAG: hypothetical protein A3F48_04380 [Candidatus Yanofskybacteria bacterium RIFCSPHIGHO2_12_FULL_41_9]OGN21202.1 MAG: hypothetical protein A2916_00480 [Candidatus Yanofskybacteria bacterium RIFCSPLOWO2_01_FULL_41_67]OGN28442.1 MAG: hypothetical protein A3H54_03225 